MRGPVEVRRPPFCMANCVPSVCERAQSWSNCHRVYAPQGAPSVRTGCACRKAAGRRAGTHLQGRRMLSRHMHSVAKRPALFQINAVACYLTGALRAPLQPFALRSACPSSPRTPSSPRPPPSAHRPTRAISLPGGSAGAFRLSCRLACHAALPLRLVDHVVAGDLVDGSISQVERDEAV